MSPVRQLNQLRCCLGGRLVWDQTAINLMAVQFRATWRYDGVICAAAMRAVATIAVATCFQLFSVREIVPKSDAVTLGVFVLVCE